MSFVVVVFFWGGMFGGRKGGGSRMISENVTLTAYRVVYDIAVFFFLPGHGFGHCFLLVCVDFHVNKLNQNLPMQLKSTSAGPALWIKRWSRCARTGEASSHITLIIIQWMWCVAP